MLPLMEGLQYVQGKAKAFLTKGAGVSKGIVAVTCKWKSTGCWVLGVMIGTMPGVEYVLDKCLLN